MGKRIKKQSLRLDRLLSLPLHGQLALMGVLFGLLLLGGWALMLHLESGGGAAAGDDALTPFWLTLLPMVDPGHLLLATRTGGLAPRLIISLFSLLGLILLGGFFLSSFVGVRDERARRAREGRGRYRLPKGYALLLGWDATAPGIIRKYCTKDEGPPLFVILSSVGAERIRGDLTAADAYLCPRKIVIYDGNHADPDELSSLEPEHASRLYILGDAGSESRDSKCLETTVHLLEIMEERKKGDSPLPCAIHIDAPNIFSMLQKVDFFGKNERCALDIRLFNFFEGWAGRVWSTFPATQTGGSASPLYPPLARDALRCRKGAGVHLIVIGFGRMGQALTVEACRACHYANGSKTRITIIDRNLGALRERFASSCFVTKGGENRFHDIEFAFLEEPIESEIARERLLESLKEKERMLTVAVCLSDVDASLACALSLPLEIKKSDTPILVRQQGHSGLGALAKRLSGSRNTENIEIWKNLRFFGGLDECFEEDERNERLAMLLNAIYRIFEDDSCAEELRDCLAEEGAAENFSGSLEELFWRNQETKFRWSSRYQARAFMERVRSLGLIPAATECNLEKRPLFPFERNSEPSNVLDEAKKTLEQALHNARRETKALMLAKSLGFEAVETDDASPEEALFSSLAAMTERLSESEHDRWWAERILAGWEPAKSTDKSMLKHADMIEYAELDEAAKAKDRRIVELTPWLLEKCLGITLRYPNEGSEEDVRPDRRDAREDGRGAAPSLDGGEAEEGLETGGRHRQGEEDAHLPRPLRSVERDGQGVRQGCRQGDSEGAGACGIQNSEGGRVEGEGCGSAGDDKEGSVSFFRREKIMCYSIKGTVIVEVEAGKSEKFSILLKPESAFIPPYNKEYALAFKNSANFDAIGKKCEQNSQIIKLDNVDDYFRSVLLSAAGARQIVEVFVEKKEETENDWKITKVRFPAS